MIDKTKLNDLPDRPGVYLMKDKDKEIIYVGKARNLKNRVRQYFQGEKSSLKVSVMVEHIVDFEIIVTDTEMEALILECNLIKKNMPHFNIMLKDDKSYPYIKLTLNEKYPRVIMTRQIKKDNAKYFGPYTNVASVKQTIELINKMYPIKKCNKKFTKEERPCLYYHIGQCMGICKYDIDEFDKNKYQNYILEIQNILNGKFKNVLKDLEVEMIAASNKYDYEKAAQIRDQINGINHISEKQKIVSNTDENIDVISFYRGEISVCIQIFYVRNGKLLGRNNYIFENEQDDMELITAFVKQLYDKGQFIPKEILLPIDIDDREILQEWLTNINKQKVIIKIPQKGHKKKLVDMAYDNAKLTLEDYESRAIKNKEKQDMSYDWLINNLGLDKKPTRIEAYDISNIKGTDNVGSMVVYEDLKANKKAYRRFKIKNVEGQNDYASMQEIVFRRIEKGKKEMKLGIGGFLPFPDIIFLDGGLGHINAIKEILSLYPEINIPIFGLVKDDHHKLRGVIYEGKSIEIPQSTPIYYLLNNISEEVHRFTIEYHKKLRDSKLIQSQLNEIEGVGDAKKRDLLKYFKGIDAIKKASIEELMDVKGISNKLAINIYDYFH